MIRPANKTFLGCAAAFLVLALSGCGGGGGGEPTEKVASAHEFNFRVAWDNNAKDTRSLPFSLSGSIDGMSISGSGSIMQSSLSPAIFEGRPALQKTVTSTGTMTVGGQEGPLYTSATSYLDPDSYAPLGSHGALEYTVLSGPFDIPGTVRVHDTGLMGRHTIYPGPEKSYPIGEYIYSYAVEPHTASTALIRLIAERTGSDRTTVIQRFILTPEGELTRVQMEGISANGVRMTFKF